MSSWVYGHWVWKLRRRRDLFVWELDLIESLFVILNGSPFSAAFFVLEA
jgi:hypothetical protein